MDFRYVIFFFCVIFLVTQTIPLISSESCISDLNVNIGIYEVHYNPKLYERSPYQPASDDRFVRENDVLIIEELYAKAGSSCQEIETIIIQFKRPDSEKWGEDISIPLNFSMGSEYSFELLDKPKFNSIIYVQRDGNQFNRGLSKTLSNNGVWGIRVVGADRIDENETIRDSIINDNLILDDWEFLVMGRLEVTQLETLRQIMRDSNKIFIKNLIISIFSILIMLVIGIATIYFMDKHHKEQIKKEDKREEERQISLLESLYSELDKISSKKGEIKILDKKIATEGNLQWVKELFGWGLKPAHSIWKLNTQIYVANLNRTIKGKKTNNLKSSLLHISQKIELVENYLEQYNQAKKEDNDIKDAIMKVINEVIELVEITKKLIEEDFGINIKDFKEPKEKIK